MKFKKYRTTAFATLLALIVTQSFAGFEMKRHSINSGGGKITGGSYTINASIGQVDASAVLSNGSYEVNGGFWHKNTSNSNELIFQNGFE